MRRLVAILAVAGAAGSALLFTGAHGGEGEARRYVIELDNAFGMVLGGDVRVAGVNAGHVTDVELDERSLKALIEVEIDEEGFGSLREDTRCETRPQSPLGEYFLDCEPGTSDREIEPGGRVPVERTTSTIPPDLVQNIMRRPYAERFRLVINEFGAGLAGRPEDLNEAIRRGVPALRQTSRVLAILAEHNQVIRGLVRDADRVIGKLADEPPQRRPLRRRGRGHRERVGRARGRHRHELQQACRASSASCGRRWRRSARRPSSSGRCSST